MRVQFGDFLFNSEMRELTRGGEALHLLPKALRFLEVLLENRPKPVSKERLQNAVWPDSFVDESNLATLAAEIRGTLGDDARRPTFIRTVHGFGYAFCAEARSVSDPPETGRDRASVAFRLLWGEREIGLPEGEHFLGRDAQTQIWIDSVAASRRHARIVVSGSEATLEDLGSKNGTILNGQVISGTQRLTDGDRIQIAHANLTFRVFSTTGSTATHTDK